MSEQRQVELDRAGLQVAQLESEPRQRQRAARGAFCSAKITWNSGVWARLALGLQLLDQRSNGTSWCA